MIPKIIKERTLRGQFAREGSSGTRARYYNARHARRYGKNVNGPVDLFITGDLHRAIKGKTKFLKTGVRVGAQVKGGSARKKFDYIQNLGSGRSRIKRRFMYLNNTEANRVIRAMIRAGLSDAT